MRRVRAVIAGIIAARASLKRVRPAHFTPLGSWGHTPRALVDLPDDQIDAINQKSDEYYDVPDQHRFWIDKPMSDPRHGPESLWRFGLLLSALQVGPLDRVLDFGCGTGWTSALLARTGADVVGMDISARALEIARKGSAVWLAERPDARLRFERFNGRSIDAPDGHFDFVIFFDSFHHLPNPLAVLRECSRLLGPHGSLGFAEPGFGHSHSHTSAHEIDRGVLENEVDPEQLRAAGLAVGFTELELIVPPPTLVTVPMRRAGWFLRGLPIIVPQDATRAAMLSAPIGFLRKGPYSSTSLHPHVLLATLTTSANSFAARAGEKVTLTVTVRNDAGTVWLREGRRGSGYVRLGAKVIRARDGGLVGEWPPVDLPHDLLQSMTCQLQIGGPAPPEPGDYTIRLDMIDEGIAWFAERGSKTADVRMTVRAGTESDPG